MILNAFQAIYLFAVFFFYQMLLDYQDATSNLADVNEEELGHGAGNACKKEAHIVHMVEPLLTDTSIIRTSLYY